MQVRKNLIGHKFNHLTVIGYDEKKSKKSGKSHWVCQCDCGNNVVVAGYNLMNGHTTSCGCAKKLFAQKFIFQDLSGQKFGRLTVLELDIKKTKETNHTYWICRCDCGKTLSVWASNLKNGNTQSCGCYWSEQTVNAHFKDLTGSRFGRLIVVEKDVKKTKERGQTYWICRCDCGNFKSISTAHLLWGMTKSCGCIGASLGEFKIAKLLDEMKIDYETEYTFQDLKTSKNSCPRFDFAIFKNNELNCLIEYQGKQHYTNHRIGKRQREETDVLKRTYCKNHYLRLVEIPYWEYDCLDQEYLLKAMGWKEN